MNILEEANTITTGERQKVYGHPYDDYSRTAALWSAILGHEVTAAQAALCMIAVKLSRLCNTPDHRDTMIDIAGYIRVYEMILEKGDGKIQDLLEPQNRPPDHCWVDSRTSPGMRYLVMRHMDGRVTCTCPDHQFRGRVCKHIFRSGL